MPVKLLYWILMLLLLLAMFGGVYLGIYGAHASSVIIYILLVILGWKVVGNPIER